MDQFQKAVAEAYAGGEFNCDEVLDLVKNSPEDIGDGLFIFLMSEISEDEDCDSFEDAVKRLETIIRQVEGVKKAVELKEIEEEA